MVTWFSEANRLHRTIRANTLVWCLIYLLLVLVIICRFIWLQAVKYRWYRDIANQYHMRTSTLPATRGPLLDRDRVVLALDDQRKSLFVDPVLVQYPEFTAQQLAPIIARPEAEILADLTRGPRPVWLKCDLTDTERRQVAQLRLPGLQVEADGLRYRIGVDLQKLPRSNVLTEQLATALGMPVAEVSRQLGRLESEPADEEGKPLVAGQRWLLGTFSEHRKAAVDQLKFPGLLTVEAGPNYSLRVDPRVYLAKNPPMEARDAAALLAPVLAMKPDDVAARLRTRPRFVWLKRGLSVEMLHAIQRLQGSMYVVKPGIILDSTGRDDRPEERMADAVERLYILSNQPDGGPGVSKDEIRRRLDKDGKPGVMTVQLVNDEPSLKIARSLYARPIPGVMYGLPGIGIQQERRRQFPFGTLAAQTLGFTTYGRGHTLVGAFGLEQSQERVLQGIDGHEVKEIDARHVTIPEQVHERVNPRNGREVMLTLDQDIQQTAEEEIAKARAATGALAVHCVVLNPKTGEILALASTPGWDANAPGDHTVPLVNPIVNNFYEPGSTFKLVPVVASLEEGVIRPGQIIMTCTGALPIGRRAIHEAHNAHGQVDVERLLMQSCNLGAATLARRLGGERFLKWCDRFGFGSRTGVEIACESPGTLNRANVKAEITLANMGFGQSLAVTPLQLAAAYAAIANHGVRCQPHLVKKVKRPDGTFDETKIESRPVCSRGTADLVLHYLEEVVTDGTGGNAKIDGYRVGGKTGTAQKPVGKLGFRAGKYIGSFVGIMPIEDPQLVILVVVDEPKGSIYGGSVAAPAVREIGRQALQFLSIPPTLKPGSGGRR